jgi:hypothetical protein
VTGGTINTAALALILEAVVDAVRAGGPEGVPGGTLYAALMSVGCTYEQFEHIMSALVKFGKLRKSGKLYFVVSP